MMKITNLVYELVSDVDSSSYVGVTELIRRVRFHKNYNSILLLLKNSKKSVMCLSDLYDKILNGFSVDRFNERIDKLIAMLFVLVKDSENTDCTDIISSMVSLSRKCCWTKAVVAGYSIQEGLNEKLHITA